MLGFWLNLDGFVCVTNFGCLLLSLFPKICLSTLVVSSMVSDSNAMLVIFLDIHSCQWWNMTCTWRSYLKINVIRITKIDGNDKYGNNRNNGTKT